MSDLAPDAATLPPVGGGIEAPQAVALGLIVGAVADGTATMRLPWRADLVGDPVTRVMAPGAVTTLIDHACGSAVFSALAAASVEGVGSIATLDLRIDYMRAATPELTLVARAHCYKITPAIAFVRAAAFDLDEADPVATAQAAFALNTARPRP